MSVRLNETQNIVDKMVNFFVEHEDLRTKVSLIDLTAQVLRLMHWISFHRAGSSRMHPDRCS